MRRYIFILLIYIFGCNNIEEAQLTPNVPTDILLLTPQADNMSETDAQFSSNQEYFWYIVSDLDFNNHYFYSIYYQIINNNERHNIVFPSYSLPPELGFRNIRVASSDEYMILAELYLLKFNYCSPPPYVLAMLPVYNPRISPDNKYIAYECDYPYLAPDNVYLITPEGDQLGPRIQITHSEEAPTGYFYSYLPICWLSNYELVIRRKRNKNPYDLYDWAYDMQKYNIDDLSSPPVLLTSVEGDDDQPMGYSELINQNEGWYIDSFGDVQEGYSNLYKCPLGIAGDYGEQLTFGGNWDIPNDLSADGHKIIFTRKYRRGCHYLTGNSDIYMMDLNGGVLQEFSSSDFALAN